MFLLPFLSVPLSLYLSTFLLPCPSLFVRVEGGLCICIPFTTHSLCILVTYKLGDSSGDQDFEDRFLNCFGLGEADSHHKAPVARTPSQPDSNEREHLLKEQSKVSPWCVCLHELNSYSEWYMCVCVCNIC